MLSQAISFNESKLWFIAMKEEMNSMAVNGVWDLVQLPDDVKAIGCKWVFKTKKDSSDKIERYKVCTTPDIAFIVGMLGRYRSNLCLDHWKAAKKVMRSLRIYCDNSATIFMAKNNKSGSRSKYTNIKYLAIRERVKYMKLLIEHISNELMIADPLTKGMSPLKFKDHIEKMRLDSFM
ncbi:uncharacterized protein [Primulina eburnea]|uniref:uncharacterized protein n=1 Tax=Primulina eburnea TaxID=1245227 RepID=UPI003C6C91EF